MVMSSYSFREQKLVASRATLTSERSWSAALAVDMLFSVSMRRMKSPRPGL